MQVSVSKEGKLGRKMKVEVPVSEIQKHEERRLKKLAKTVKIDGFRKGKIPMKIIKERYGAQVRNEILSDTIQSSLIDALTKEKLNPAGMPHITDTTFEEGQPLVYTAAFEVYPEVELKSFDKIKIDKPVAEVTDTDIEETIDSIRQQNKDWSKVEREAKNDDQVDINFVGSIDGEEFEGGKAENFKLELGKNKMIPGFEDGIIGMKAGEEKVIDVSFPDEYSEKNLAGKEAKFKITLNTVEGPSLSELNDAFAERMGIKEGGLEKLKEEVRLNMQRELEQALKTRVKQSVMDELLSQNKLDLPKSLIDTEIEHLQKQAEQQFGKHMSLDGLKDKSNDVFEKEAARRVALGLIVSEVVQAHKIKVDPTRVRKMVESIAEAYQKPEDVVAMYYNDKQRLAGIEALILEEIMVEKILETAKVTEKETTFKEIIKPQ